jgi:peptidyl-prolyl cis-trans isomerase A (cyclophilin A)
MRVIISILMIIVLVSAVMGDDIKSGEAKKEMPKKMPMESYVYVLMKTSMGDITLELDKTKAPVTVANFLKYAGQKAYDGTIFHRVMDGFMIQGGGFNPDMTKRETDEPIVNEWENGLKNMRGTIAMARLGGQANSATNQFFINLVDNTPLDTPRDGAGYAVFGKVINGMDVVDAIAKVETGNKDMYQNVPVKPVTIIEVKEIEAPKKAVEPEKKTESPKEGKTK